MTDQELNARVDTFVRPMRMPVFEPVDEKAVGTGPVDMALFCRTDPRDLLDAPNPGRHVLLALRDMSHGQFERCVKEGAYDG